MDGEYEFVFEENEPIYESPSGRLRFYANGDDPGGGDVVFPIILAGVVLHTLGLWQAVTISIGATIALGLLFHASKKGKFYPAMPFISAGCLVALGLVYLI